MFTSQREIEKARTIRYKARTDLLFLAREILGYKKIRQDVHGGLIDTLQKFPLPEFSQQAKLDAWDGAKWRYTPLTPFDDFARQVGPQRVLILDFRGAFKSTINAVSHTIQWIINYPNIAILFVQSNLDKAEEVLGEIKDHFKSNPAFRFYFPEHCPQTRINDWGRMMQFTTEARDEGYIRKEPTVTACSIDKGTAGMHYDVIKFSDIVDPSNCITPERIEATFKSFVGFKFLLVNSSRYWMDVEGTRYDYNDTYGRIIDNEMKLPPEKRQWRIYARGCFKKQHPDGLPLKHTPEELDYPDALDENGKRISNFPQEFPVEALEALRTSADMTEESFACQMKNNPADVSPEHKMFPLEYFQTLPRDVFKDKWKISYYTTTVDTADTQEAYSDFSAVTTIGWSASGKAVVVDIKNAKYKPMELIEAIFLTYRQFKPVSITIEEDRYVNGLKPMIERLMQLGQKDPHGNVVHPWLPLKYVKRDNRQKKIDRILFTLQPWYKARDIYFLDDLPALDTVRSQFMKFPKSIHDDILDTLADQFQGRTFFGRTMDREPEPSLVDEIHRRMRRDWENQLMGINTLAQETADTGGFFATGPPSPSELDMTGGL